MLQKQAGVGLVPAPQSAAEPDRRQSLLSPRGTMRNPAGISGIVTVRWAFGRMKKA